MEVGGWLLVRIADFSVSVFQYFSMSAFGFAGQWSVGAA
jgi:hypothetical protein